MLVTSGRFAAAQKTVRVKLLIDQKIKGLALSAGDVVDLSGEEARRLGGMGRVEIVASDFGEDNSPKVANR